MLVFAAVVVWWWGNRHTNQAVVEETMHAVAPLPQPVRISSKVLFTGNTFWGRYVADWSETSPLKYEYPFSGLKAFHRERYNAWISGLECPMAADVHMTSAEQEENLQFNCSPDFLPEAKKWFTAFTLANNHTDNQGADGFMETQEHLERQGIQYFGHYDPKKLDDICEVISLPVTVVRDDKTKQKGKLPMALCGYHGVFEIPSEASVAVISQYSKVMPVIAMPHTGAEYKPVPDQIKTDFYRSLIDAGADAVIADHPHWIQSTESYKGHLIAYSMGNFMFDQQGSEELTRSAAIQMNMDVKKVNSAMLEAWLKIGEECATYHDDCLEDITVQKLQKLPIIYKFGVFGTRDDNKLTHLANADENAAILQRLDWQKTMSQLQSPYSSL